MRDWLISRRAVGTLLLFLSLGGALARGGELRCGAALSDITPPLGENIVGGFSPSPSKHVHDPLHARALVLDDGTTRIALVVTDLLGIHRSVSDEARRLIAERSNIPREHVLISATHTHSASSALGQNRLNLDAPLEPYQQFVARRIADAVQGAINTLRSAELAYIQVDAPEHVFNRRWFMRPGTMPENPFGTSDLVKMNPPGGSPNLVEPAGPTDPAVSVIMAREPDSGQPIGCFASYSLHYVGDVGPGHISADYFAIFCTELAQRLEATRLDPPFVAMLANGTSGDVNNNNFRSPRPRKPTYGQMRYVASDVAQKVFDGLKQAKYARDLSVAAAYRELPIASRRPTDEQMAWAKKTIAEQVHTPGKANLPLIYAERTLRVVEYPATLELPIQVLRIGDVCLGTLPCEVFCEIGLEFKRRAPFAHPVMVSLNHGYYGYLPTPRQHELGGYETWIGTNRLEKQASEKMMTALLEMAGELKSRSSAK